MNTFRQSVTQCAGRLPALFTALLCTAGVWAQCSIDVIENPDPYVGQWVNMSLAADGDLLVIGAPEQWYGELRGTAHVYRRAANDWIYEAALYASGEALCGCYFGETIAVSGDVVVVGAPCYAEGCGAAVVFERLEGQWVEVATLTPEDPTAASDFGRSVGVSGNWIAIGAPAATDPESGFFVGAVYMYERAGDDWLLAQELRVPQLEPEPADDLLGMSVSLCGGTLAAGAPGRPPFGGAVPIFEHSLSGWVLCHELITPFSAGGFGQSVALHGDWLIASRSASNEAEIWHRNATTWSRDTLLTPEYEGSRFGAALAISDEHALVGQPDSWAGGVVYIYSRSSDWSQAATLFGPFMYGETLAATEFWAATSTVGGFAFAADVIALGPDCDGNEIPDQCQGYIVDVHSGYIGPFGADFSVNFVVTAPPPAASVVELKFEALADLGAATEWVDVYLNGTYLGPVFVFAGSDCPDPEEPDVDTLSLTGEEFSMLVPAGQDAIIDMIASEPVDAFLCADPFPASQIAVTVRYIGSGPGDCNGNLVPDICEIVAGELDDTDADGIPDICDSDPIAGDTNCDRVVNAFDIDPFVLALTDPGGYEQRFAACSLLAADCNADGVVNAFDIDPFVQLLVGK